MKVSFVENKTGLSPQPFSKRKTEFHKERGESFLFVHTGERERLPRTPRAW